MLMFILHALRTDPEIAVFLAIALGVFIGRIRIGSFHLGSVAGALLMGLPLLAILVWKYRRAWSLAFFVMFILRRRLQRAGLILPQPQSRHAETGGAFGGAVRHGTGGRFC